MVEVYSLVETKKSQTAKLVSGLLLAASLGVLAFSFLVASLAFFCLFILVAALWFYVTFRYSVEYEVSYFDGEFRFAKIINKSRRKKMESFTAEELVQIAPSGDRSVSNYLRDNSARKMNLTSGTDAPYYAMVRRNADRTIVYLVELDEKFLDEVCKKNAMKVIK